MNKKYLVGIFGDEKLGVSHLLRDELGASNVLVFSSSLIMSPPHNDLELVIRTLEHDEVKKLFFDCCSHIIIGVFGLKSFSMLVAGIKAVSEKTIETLMIIGDIDLENFILLGEEEEQREIRSAIKEGRLVAAETFSLPEWMNFSKL